MGLQFASNFANADFTSASLTANANGRIRFEKGPFKKAKFVKAKISAGDDDAVGPDIWLEGDFSEADFSSASLFSKEDLSDGVGKSSTNGIGFGDRGPLDLTDSKFVGASIVAEGTASNVCTAIEHRIPTRPRAHPRAHPRARPRATSGRWSLVMRACMGPTSRPLRFSLAPRQSSSTNNRVGSRMWERDMCAAHPST